MRYISFFKTRAELFSLILLCCVVALSGCTGIKTTKKPLVPKAYQLAKTATAEQLFGIVAQLSDVKSLKSPSLVVDAEGGAIDTGKIEKYRSVPGYIFLERPDHIRFTILVPVAKTTIFDMASNGALFQIWYPRDNKFFVGDTNITKISNPELAKNPLSKFRPQHLSHAILVEGIPLHEPEKKYFIYEDQDNVAKYYILSIVGAKSEARAQLLRQIWIERSQLQVVRQQYYEGDGSVLSDIRYNNYQPVGNLAFPWKIRIERPNDKYAITLTFKTLQLNETLSADMFTLTKPPAAELVQIKS